MNAPLLWRCRDQVYDLTDRTLVMGILNVTPDSFSDGSKYLDPAAAVARAHELFEQGADLLDLGAESTRPGSEPVPAAEQLRRLTPVLERLPGDLVLSIDTRSAEVARHALEHGVRIVNDVSALSDPAMAEVVARTEAGLVLMHMRGNPATMQDDTTYGDLVAEVSMFLTQRRHQALMAGIDDASIAFDPGIGFGKSVEGSVAVLAATSRLAALGRPVLIGASRKSMLFRLTGDAVTDDRVPASLAAAAIATLEGARIVRVHDVAPTVRAVKVALAVRAARAAR